MKATRSRDGQLRVTARVEFRVVVVVELAANAIADQLFDDIADADDVPSLGSRRLERALRDALRLEGEHLFYAPEHHEYNDEWPGLVAAVREQLVEAGVFPSATW